MEPGGTCSLEALVAWVVAREQAEGSDTVWSTDGRRVVVVNLADATVARSVIRRGRGIMAKRWDDGAAHYRAEVWAWDAGARAYVASEATFPY